MKKFSAVPIGDRAGDNGAGSGNNGGSGGGGMLEPRVARLETNLDTVRSDVSVIRSNYATKEDLHKEISTQTWNLVKFVTGFGTILAAAVYFIARNVG